METIMWKESFYLTVFISRCAMHGVYNFIIFFKNVLSDLSSGHAPGFGERDHPRKTFTPIAVVRTSQPRFTDTAKYVQCLNVHACKRNLSGLLLLGIFDENLMLDVQILETDNLSNRSKLV